MLMQVPNYKPETREPRAEQEPAHVPQAIRDGDQEVWLLGQPHVTHNCVEAIKAGLGPAPGPEALFRFCLPLEAPDTPVEIREVGARRYVFRCESTDFRFHEPVLLRPEQVKDYEGFGTIAG